MSEQLLAKLKIKPIPKVKESLEIKVKKPAANKEEVIIKTKILDKTKEDKIDRQAFLLEISEEKEKKTPPKITSIKKEYISETTQIVENPIKLKIRLKLEPAAPEILPSKSPTEITPSSKDEKPTTSKTSITIKTIKTSKPSSSRLTKSPLGISIEGPTSQLIIGDTPLKNRLPPEEKKVIIRASNYYMNNREIFINFITSLFGPYKEDIEKDNKTLSCDSGKNDSFNLLTHQKIVRDYINLFTPYRGLLLYHGLGSGKTCSSIGIAEGIKTDKKIIVMTPASLRVNYMEELKKCGDLLYKKNQFWEFISTKDNPELEKSLSYVLSLPQEFIKKNNGAWLVNIKKKPNYESLSSQERILLDAQITEMIKAKYKFINYNGLRNSHLQNMTANYTINPFDNSVVIIDEAHNLVSRIVNKLKGKSDSLSIKLYEYLMTAENAKIILLTGTPIINYPNEIGILFNILRGKIRTYKFKLVINQARKINQDFLFKLFKSSSTLTKLMDYIEYQSSSNTLIITENPFGFISQYSKDLYEGVHINETKDESLTSKQFIQLIAKILKKADISIVPGGIEISKYKALPDTLDDFKKYFIDDKNQVKNENLFKRRILGLTSYFPDIDALLPKYEKGFNFHISKIEMSKFQFSVYEEARVQERKLELANAKKRKKGADGIYDDAVSTYRIFSRAFCNFVFPRPTITRPFPNEGATIETAITDNMANEDEFDAISKQEQALKTESRIELDEAEKEIQESQSIFDKTYEGRIKSALKALSDSKDQFLTPDALKEYSPKFLNVLENIQDPSHKGLHLIYSQFRTLEGIGIIKLVLEANGFTEFKLKKDLIGNWVIDIAPENRGKPTFALYTGTETAEVKEIVRNIFNSTWEYVPSNIVEELKTMSSNNYSGEIIKVFMITASGAEGISLHNVRFVHLIEPYWHPVRLEQVIGRARRICSHKNLPVEEQTVDVFLYLMIFSKEQMESDDSIELRLKDRSKIDNITPLTSDQALYEISTIKEDINKSILKAVKESAIDCILYLKPENKENLKCFSFGSPSPNKLSYQPSIENEEEDSITQINKKEENIKAKKVKIEGIEYAFDPTTGKVFDYKSYLAKNPIQVGILEIKGKQFNFKKL
jgi:hypothetical protein